METPSTTAWQGFHHVAVATPDLDATIRFYGDVLGMSVGDILTTGVGVDGRHCFIRPGNTDTWGLHVFQNPDPALKAALEASRRRVLEASSGRVGFFDGVLQHIAFALPDEQAALAIRARLQQHDVWMTPINEIGTIRNFLFLDNNGLLLEATWPK